MDAAPHHDPVPGPLLYHQHHGGRLGSKCVHTGLPEKFKASSQGRIQGVITLDIGECMGVGGENRVLQVNNAGFRIPSGYEWIGADTEVCK